MSIKHTTFVGAVAVFGLLLASCSSPAAEGGGGGDASDDAVAAAEALGIDLDACPTDVTEPLTGTINVGQTVPQTGPVAPALGVLGPAVKEAFAQFNADSGLDVDFNLIQLDDAFAPDRALTSTQTLIDRDNIDVMTGVVGTAQVAAIRDVLGAECIPLLPGVSAGTSANDPEQYPWTAVHSQPSALDARIMLADVTERHPGGATVAVLYANNESGRDYLEAIEKYQGDNEIVAVETVEATDTASPSSQITTLRSSGADAFLAVSTAAQCATIMQEVANQGWEGDFYMTSTCASTTFDVAGPAADGWHITTYGKDANRGEFVDDPAVVHAIESITAASPNTPITTTTVQGFSYAEPFFEAVRIAADSPLGLSRLGLLVAFTSLDYQPDLLKPNVRFKLDGLTDQVAIEASYLSVYDAETQLFDDIEFYDFEGEMTD